MGTETDPPLRYGRRPIGVSIAATVMILAAAVGAMARLATGSVELVSIVWLVFHAFTIVVAVGLFRRRPWAYWITLLLVGGGAILTAVRLIGVATQLPPVYHIVRLAVHAIWFAYFLLPNVRRSFESHGALAA